MFRTGRQDEEQLVRAVLAGRRDDYGLLVQQRMSVVHAVAFAHTGNYADAEDVAQEAFLKGLQTLDTLREPAKFGAWVVSIARHIACDTARRRVREARLTTEAAPAELTTLPNMERREMRTFVREQIDQLEEEPREALLLHYFAGRPTAEIASLLNISEATARKRLQRAREALGERILAELGETARLEPRLRRRATEIANLAAAVAVPWKAMPASQAPFPFASGLRGVSAMPLAKAFVSVAVVVAGIGVWRSIDHSLTPPAQTPPVRIAADSQVTDRTHRAVAPTPLRPAVLAPKSGTAQPGANVSVSGKVVAPRPAASAMVTAYVKEPELRLSAPVLPDNTFNLPGFTSGSSILLFADSGSLRSRLYGPIPLSEKGLSDYVVTLEETGVVRGTVVDPEGRPVPEVLVRASAPDELRPLPPVQCDKAGCFELSGLVPGGYAIQAALPNNDDFDTPGESVNVQGGEVKRDVAVVLDLGGNMSIAGRVADPDGKPLKGVSVQVWERPRWQTQTDRDGKYRLAGPSDMKYAIETRASGYAHHTQWDVAAGSDNVDFALPRVQTTLAGRVVRADTEAAIPDFELQFVPGAGGDLQQLARLQFTTYRDSEGRFLLEDLPAGPGQCAMLLARARGFAMAHETVALNSDSQPQELLFRLQPEAIVEGIVITAGNIPVPGARVFAGPLENLYNLDQLAAAHTNDRGEFRLDGLSADTTAISAHRADHSAGCAKVALEAGKTTSVRIVLASGGIVEGTVTANGQALPETTVRLFAVREPAQSPRQGAVASLEHPGQDAGDTRTDATGHFRFDAVPAGPAVLWVFFPYPPAADASKTTIRRAIRSVTVGNAKVTQVAVDFTAQRAVLEGTAVCDGILAENGHVRVWAGPEASREFRLAQIEQGVFRIEDLAPGPAQLEIHALFDGKRELVRQKQQAVNLSESEPVRVTVDFGQGARLSGRLTGPAGNLDTYVDVFQGNVDVSEDGQLPIERLVWQGPPDTTGAFSIRGLDAGTYTVVATLSAPHATTQSERKAGYRIVSVPVELAENADSALAIPMR